MTEWWRKSAGDLASAIASKKVSAEEVMESHLERVDQVNGKLNAITVRLDEEARAGARAADAAVAAGEPLGPLHGVPVTIKENVDQKGYATTNGVEAFVEMVADDDSPVVANLRKAGAIPMGRTNTPEFSLRYFTDNTLRGLTHNPWSKDLTPGGSSGGASAAVASGMGSIGHGNDLGGSVRYPAYACGIVGIRPSMGRVPAYNPDPDRGAAADHPADERSGSPLPERRRHPPGTGRHGRPRSTRSLVGAGAARRRRAPHATARRDLSRPRQRGRRQERGGRGAQGGRRARQRRL